MNKIVIVLNTDKPKEMVDKITSVVLDSSWEHKIKECAIWVDPKFEVPYIKKWWEFWK
jgi:hypothetical protein